MSRPDIDTILEQSPLPALEGEYETAERLVLLVHRGVDWDVWGGSRRVRYWDALTDRVRASTYAGNTLSHWWQHICAEMTSAPHSADDRYETAVLLSATDQRAVLDALHSHAHTLVLRIRVLSEHRRSHLTGLTAADEPETETV